MDTGNETDTGYSRRGVMTAVGTLLAGIYGLPTRARAAISYTLEYIYTIPDGEVVSPPLNSYDMFEWDGTGVLEFEDGEYVEFGDANYPSETDVIERPGITLPMGIDFRSMETGTSVFLIGIMGTLLGGVYVLKNYAAGVMWGIALVFLILAGMFGLPLELYWFGIVGTVLLLIVGMAVRMNRS